MPEGALLGAWTKSAHKLWVKRLRRISSVSELLQVIYLFVVCSYFKPNQPGFSSCKHGYKMTLGSMAQQVLDKGIVNIFVVPHFNSTRT